MINDTDTFYIYVATDNGKMEYVCCVFMRSINWIRWYKNKKNKEYIRTINTLFELAVRDFIH